mmetsp:Transcript_45532/g.105540  ORF Transcript_45532/g.105540 Transcript_45532/m.105540 type:complete len:412 (+) Transcript_45532:47-1282(+)
MPIHWQRPRSPLFELCCVLPLAWALRPYVDEIEEVLAVNDLPDLDEVTRRVAEGLASPGYTDVHFHTPAWQIPMDMDRADPPYKDTFRRLGNALGEYMSQDHHIYVSANDVSFLTQLGNSGMGRHVEKQWLGFGTDGKRCPEERARVNCASQRAVIRVAFNEAGFFGHAIDNVLPRLIPALRGARQANFTAYVLIPAESRNAFSHNTEVLINMLGAELLKDVPAFPHRAVSVSLVSGWDKRLRQAAQQDLQRSILHGLQPARCDGTSAASAAEHAVFLSRAHGAAHRRTPGDVKVEDLLRKRGVVVWDNIGGMDVLHVARTLYSGTCTLIGFAGTQLLNLLFLPPHATVIEYNPHGLYADYWQWAHALDLNYKYTVPDVPISDEEAKSLVEYTMSQQDPPLAKLASTAASL